MKKIKIFNYNVGTPTWGVRKRVFGRPMWASLLVTFFLTSCGGQSDHDKALAVDASIDSALATGDFTKAVSLIDTLNQKYPKEIDLRKASGKKRAKAIEGLSMQAIPKLDSMIAADKQRVAELEGSLTFQQPTKALPGYYIYKESTASSVQPRLNVGDDARDCPWTVALNAGRNIGLNSATFVFANGSETAITVTSPDGIVASVTPEAADPVAQQCSEGNNISKIVLSGAKGKVNVSAKPALSQAFAIISECAKTQEHLQTALVNREKTERQLLLARDQAAQ